MATFDSVDWIEKIFRAAWSQHYRIPRLAFFLGLVVALILMAGGPGEPLLAGLVLLGVSLVGLVRWQLAIRRCGGTLVVPRFFEGGGATGHAVEAQNLIVDDLRRHLPPNLDDLVQPLPVTVGPTDERFAEQLQRRLRAAWVLHGRIAGSANGWSVFPRILEPATRSATHTDPYTRDITPANPRFGPIVSNLPPQIGVRDEEFPLEFCRDLEAMGRGIAGVIAGMVGDDETAVEELDRALAVAGPSPSHLVDQLHVSRGFALRRLDKIDEALDALRARASEADPSSHLLRGLAFLLTSSRYDVTDEAEGEAFRQEAMAALRKALKDERDPQHDITVYNLYALLDQRDPDERAEANRFLDELLGSQSNYRRQWYVMRAMALRYWVESEEPWAAGEQERAKELGREAGRWYSRAIRARPRIQFLGIARRRPFIRIRRFHRSPILHANARDAHGRAEHRLRALWHELRYQQARKKLERRGHQAVNDGNWTMAFSYFDWCHVGRLDPSEIWIQTWAACCVWKRGDLEKGVREWNSARDLSPVALFARANLANRLEQYGHDTALPGDEPVDFDGIVEFIESDRSRWSEEVLEEAQRWVAEMAQAAHDHA